MPGICSICISSLPPVSSCAGSCCLSLCSPLRLWGDSPMLLQQLESVVVSIALALIC